MSPVLCRVSAHLKGAHALPASQLKHLCGLPQWNPGASFSLQYTIARCLPTAAAAAKALSSMQRFAFTPLDTPWGTLSIGVEYSASAALSLLEQLSVPAVHPQVITDYVGGQQVRSCPSPQQILAFLLVMMAWSQWAELCLPALICCHQAAWLMSDCISVHTI